MVYNVGFYLTEYKLVSPSSHSSSNLHRTHSRRAVVPSYSLRTVVKVLVLVVPCRLLSIFVVSRHIAVVLRHTQSPPHIQISRSILRRTGDPALYPHSAVLVLVFIGDSVICALAGVSFWSPPRG